MYGVIIVQLCHHVHCGACQCCNPAEHNELIEDSSTWRLTNDDIDRDGNCRTLILWRERELRRLQNWRSRSPSESCERHASPTRQRCHWRPTDQAAGLACPPVSTAVHLPSFDIVSWCNCHCGGHQLLCDKPTIFRFFVSAKTLSRKYAVALIAIISNGWWSQILVWIQKIIN